MIKKKKKTVGKFMEEWFSFSITIQQFFFHLLGKKSKYNIQKCKQKIKPLFVCDLLYDKNTKWIP